MRELVHGFLFCIIRLTKRRHSRHSRFTDLSESKAVSQQSGRDWCVDALAMTMNPISFWSFVYHRGMSVVSVGREALPGSAESVRKQGIEPKWDQAISDVRFGSLARLSAIHRSCDIF